jgi:hypothetical protein
MPMDEAALLSRLVDQDAILTAKQLCVEFSEPLPAAGAFLQSLFEKYAASNGLCAVVCQSAGSAVRLERVTGTSIPSESRVVSVQRQGGRSLGQAVANQLDHDRQTWLRREDDVLLRGLAGVQRSEGIVSGPRKAVRSVPAEEQGPSRTLETVKQTKANEFFAPRSGAKTDPPVKRSGALQFKPDVRKADAVLDEDEDDIEVEEQGALRPSEPAPAGKPAAPRSEPVKSSSSNAKRVVSSSSSDASSEDEDAQPRTKSPAKPKPKHKSPVKPKAKSPTAKAKPGKSKKAASESSSSGEEEMGTEAGKDGGDEAKTKKAKHKNKKSRVVDSDLDSSEEEDLQKRADKTKVRTSTQGANALTRPRRPGRSARRSAQRTRRRTSCAKRRRRAGASSRTSTRRRPSCSPEWAAARRVRRRRCARKRSW